MYPFVTPPTSQVDKLKNPEEVDTFKAKLRFRRAMARGEPGPEQDLEAALEDAWDKTGGFFAASFGHHEVIVTKKQRRSMCFV